MTTASTDAGEIARELAEAKANEVYASKLMLKFRDTLSNIKDGLEDEGDRIYFGSTNDADELREIIDAVEDLAWYKILASSQKKPDLYADLRELRSALSAQEAEIKRLREALTDTEAASNLRLERLIEANNEIERLRALVTEREQQICNLIGITTVPLTDGESGLIDD